MTSPIIPSPFIADWVLRAAADGAARGAALDLAMGRGRHALLLARAGFRTYGVDRDRAAVRDAMIAAGGENLALFGWCADLTMHPLPRSRFDIIVVTRYLQRDLFPAICAALQPGGVVLYETFTSGQRAHGTGPTSADHLLDAGELRRHFSGLEELFYEEVSAPEALARIVARRTRRS
jgi:SAM-dependent methyltransferase